MNSKQIFFSNSPTFSWLKADDYNLYTFTTCTHQILIKRMSRKLEIFAWSLFVLTEVMSFSPLLESPLQITQYLLWFHVLKQHLKQHCDYCHLTKLIKRNIENWLLMNIHCLSTFLFIKILFRKNIINN